MGESKGAENYPAEERASAGHVPIGEIAGIHPKEVDCLLSQGITHGKWIGKVGGLLEISKYTGKG